MSDLECCYKQDNTKKGYVTDYIGYLTNLLKSLDTEVIERIIDAIEQAGAKEKSIYFIGNGGSAVTASHFAVDIGIGTRTSCNKQIKAISLVDNIAIITAVANDEDYSKVFVRQLEAVLQSGDVVFALSVSGNSPNIVEAIEYARQKGALTIGCTGFQGGKLKELVDISLHIPTTRGEYGPVEDIFMILNHLINTYLQMNRCGQLKKN